MGNINMTIAKLFQGIPNNLNMKEDTSQNLAAQSRTMTRIAYERQTEPIQSSLAPESSTIIEGERTALRRAVREKIECRTQVRQARNADLSSAFGDSISEEESLETLSDSVRSSPERSNQHSQIHSKTLQTSFVRLGTDETQTKDMKYSNSVIKYVDLFREKIVKEQGILRAPRLDRLNEGMPPLPREVLHKMKVDQARGVRAINSANHPRPPMMTSLSPLREELTVETLPNHLPDRNQRRFTITTIDSLMNKKEDALASLLACDWLSEPQMKWRENFIHKHFSNEQADPGRNSTRRHSFSTISHQDLSQVQIDEDLRGQTMDGSIWNYGLAAAPYARSNGSSSWAGHFEDIPHAEHIENINPANHDEKIILEVATAQVDDSTVEMPPSYPCVWQKRVRFDVPESHPNPPRRLIDGHKVGEYDRIRNYPTYEGLQELFNGTDIYMEGVKETSRHIENLKSSNQDMYFNSSYQESDGSKSSSRSAKEGAPKPISTLQPGLPPPERSSVGILKQDEKDIESSDEPTCVNANLQRNSTPEEFSLLQPTLPEPESSSSKPKQDENHVGLSDESGPDNCSYELFSDDKGLEENIPARLRSREPLFVNHGVIWYLISTSPP